MDIFFILSRSNWPREVYLSLMHFCTLLASQERSWDEHSLVCPRAACTSIAISVLQKTLITLLKSPEVFNTQYSCVYLTILWYLRPVMIFSKEFCLCMSQMTLLRTYLLLQPSAFCFESRNHYRIAVFTWMSDILTSIDIFFFTIKTFVFSFLLRILSTISFFDSSPKLLSLLIWWELDSPIIFQISRFFDVMRSTHSDFHVRLCAVIAAYSLTLYQTLIYSSIICFCSRVCLFSSSMVEI